MRIGSVHTELNGQVTWSGGIDVERIEREKSALAAELDALPKKGNDFRIGTIKSELKHCQSALEHFQEERENLLSDLRLRSEENSSSYRPSQELSDDNRYILLSLIGRGGFSEVWRALDTIEGRTVAIKIQKMADNWSEAIKNNFVRHSGREIKILRATHNTHVVEFYEYFYIGNDTLAMVMEFCPSGDLAEHIRFRHAIPENEARQVIGQVITGLLALRSDDDQRVIHYDLKPANILFRGNVAKITDFGLSKVIDESMSEIALTSQGTGTYYYAAPETLGRSSSTVMINSSVDTWALGIIFYEMLYGQRPFGQNMTQQEFQKEGVPTVISMPGKKISQEAKDFIMRCLERDPARRPRLEDIAKDDYIKAFVE